MSGIICGHGGSEEERERAFLRDGLVASLCFVVVNLACGRWPVAIFFVVSLGLRALSPIILIPAIMAMVAIYAVFWTGRYEVAGMRDVTAS